MGMIGASAPGAQGDPSFLQILGRMVTHGEAPDDAALELRQRAYQMSMMRLMPQIIGSLPDDQRAAAIASGPAFWTEYDKRFAPQGVKGGDSVQYDGPSGSMTTAPLVGFDEKGGKGYSVADDGTTSAPSPAIPGGYSLANNAEISDRTGLTGGGVSTPQVVPMGSSLYAAPPPDVRGGAPASSVFGDPTVPAGVGGTAPSAASAGGAPRSVRNNNPGNVKALPGRQAWQGQVGTDPQGYAVFDSVANGQRAADLNLQAYGAHHGINTVAGVIGRWSPDASQGAYTAHVAGGLGVRPDQPIDLSDPATRQAVLGRMYGFEAGRGAAASAGGIPQRAASPAAGQSAGAIPQRGAPGGATLLAQGATKRLLSPQEVSKLGYDANTSIEQAPDGTLTVLPPGQYDANWAKGQKDLYVNSDAFKQWSQAEPALKALLANAGHLTGAAAYSMLDTFARVINPGAVARVGTIQAIEDQFGPIMHLQGGVQSLRSQGKLPVKVQQQILDAVMPFAQAHWDAAKRGYDANVAVGAQHHFGEGEMTMPIGSRPERAVITPAGMLTPSAAAGQARQLRAEAHAAIVKGANRNEVVQRLQAAGVNTAGL